MREQHWVFMGLIYLRNYNYFFSFFYVVLVACRINRVKNVRINSIKAVRVWTYCCCYCQISVTCCKIIVNIILESYNSSKMLKMHKDTDVNNIPVWFLLPHFQWLFVSVQNWPQARGPLSSREVSYT